MITWIIVGILIISAILADILIKIIDYIENKRKRGKKWKI